MTGWDAIVNPSPGDKLSGQDELKVSAADTARLITVGVMHRGWKTKLIFGFMLILLTAILAGTLSGNHYSAKAASQRTGQALVKEVLDLSQQLKARQVTDGQTQQLIQRELDILNDATIPGGKLYEESQANQARVIGLVVSCLRGVILNPSAPLPPSCSPPPG